MDGIWGRIGLAVNDVLNYLAHTAKYGANKCWSISVMLMFINFSVVQ